MIAASDVPLRHARRGSVVPWFLLLKTTVVKEYESKRLFSQTVRRSWCVAKISHTASGERIPVIMVAASALTESISLATAPLAGPDGVVRRVFHSVCGIQTHATTAELAAALTATITRALAVMWVGQAQPATTASHSASGMPTHVITTGNASVSATSSSRALAVRGGEAAIAPSLSRIANGMMTHASTAASVEATGEISSCAKAATLDTQVGLVAKQGRGASGTATPVCTVRRALATAGMGTRAASVQQDGLAQDVTKASHSVIGTPAHARMMVLAPVLGGMPIHVPVLQAGEAAIAPSQSRFANGIIRASTAASAKATGEISSCAKVVSLDGQADRAAMEGRGVNGMTIRVCMVRRALATAGMGTRAAAATRAG
jgi:hypothetical protein